MHEYQADFDERCLNRVGRQFVGVRSSVRIRTRRVAIWSGRRGLESPGGRHRRAAPPPLSRTGPRRPAPTATSRSDRCSSAATATVLLELMNTVGSGDVTGHPELALAAWASVAPERRRARRGHALHQLRELRDVCRRPVLGRDRPPRVRPLRRATRGPRGRRHAQPPPVEPRGLRRGGGHIDVEGPCEELAAEALAVFDGFWPTSPGPTVEVEPDVTDRVTVGIDR